MKKILCECEKCGKKVDEVDVYFLDEQALCPACFTDTVIATEYLSDMLREEGRF